jgi:hypothetical protein
MLRRWQPLPQTGDGPELAKVQTAQANDPILFF